MVRSVPQIARQQQQLLQQQHKINLLQQQIQVRPVCVCVCVCPSTCMYLSNCTCMCVYECDMMCVYKVHNFVIVIVAACLCPAISIWGLNQRCLIGALPPLTQTHTQTQPM